MKITEIRERNVVRKNLDFVVDEPSSFSADRSAFSELSFSEFLKAINNKHNEQISALNLNRLTFS